MDRYARKEDSTAEKNGGATATPPQERTRSYWLTGPSQAQSKENVVLVVNDGLLGVTSGQVCASNFANIGLGGDLATSVMVRLAEER